MPILNRILWSRGWVQRMQNTINSQRIRTRANKWYHSSPNTIPMLNKYHRHRSNKLLQRATLITAIPTFLHHLQSRNKTYLHHRSNNPEIFRHRLRQSNRRVIIFRPHLRKKKRAKSKPKNDEARRGQVKKISSTSTAEVCRKSSRQMIPWRVRSCPFEVDWRKRIESYYRRVSWLSWTSNQIRTKKPRKTPNTRTSEENWTIRSDRLTANVPYNEVHDGNICNWIYEVTKRGKEVQHRGIDIKAVIRHHQ